MGTTVGLGGPVVLVVARVAMALSCWVVVVVEEVVVDEGERRLGAMVGGALLGGMKYCAMSFIRRRFPCGDL